MFETERSYQRKHLRAPFKEHILYVDDNFVFKARAVNISEGGMLLKEIPHFPEEGKLAPLMLCLPTYPFFKNYSLDKLKGFSDQIFPKKVVRLGCRLVRKEGVKSEVEYAFASRIGVQFVEVDPKAQKIIAEYVDIFASNIIYLLILLDTINSDPQNLEKVRILSNILGYDSTMKIAQLRKDVLHDYKSLQWL